MRNWMEATLRIGVVLACLGGLPALAQDDPSISGLPDDPSAAGLPDDVQSFAGDWVLQQEDANAPTCALSFSDQPATGGWAVTVPDVCPSPFPAATGLAVWNVDDADGSILIMDAGQHVTLKLLADPDGFYATDADVVPRFYLVAPYEQDGAGGEEDAD